MATIGLLDLSSDLNVPVHLTNIDTIRTTDQCTQTGGQPKYRMSCVNPFSRVVNCCSRIIAYNRSGLSFGGRPKIRIAAR